MPYLRHLLNEGVRSGAIEREDEDWALATAAHGADLMADVKHLSGKVAYKNYGSALRDREAVTCALRKRVDRGQSLGPYLWEGADALPFESARVVPLGSVRKRLEPDVARPISDHSATGLNSCIPHLPMRMEGLVRIEQHLQPGGYIGVMDVEDAFPSLRIKPMYWKYMLVKWWNVYDRTDPNEYLYVTICGDFGVSSLPWIWSHFLGIIISCATCFGIQRPVSSYLDDLTHMDKSKVKVDMNMDKLAVVLKKVGLQEKLLKRKDSSQLQEVLGAQFRTLPTLQKGLPAAKVALLVSDARDLLSAVGGKVTLAAVQAYTGLAMWCTDAMPPYTRVHLGGLLAMRRGFPSTAQPHHRRRMTARARRGLTWLVRFLETWCGWCEVYNVHRPRAQAHALYTDASGGNRGGGGYWTEEGVWNLWRHTTAQRDRMIAWLELHAVRRACIELGETWRGKAVPLMIDNKTAKGCLRRCWSASSPLMDLLEHIQQLATKHDFVLVPHWIASADNPLADALSRHCMSRFWSEVANLGVAAQASSQTCQRTRRNCELRA